MDIAAVKPDRAGRLMFQLPKDSRVMRSVQPANNWGWNEMLLNKVAYLVELLAWQNTEDANNGRTESAPKLYTPPFIESALTSLSMDPNQVTRTTDEIKDILSRPRV